MPTALGERLARRGVVADVFVVGGAAMAMAYDATRVTREVDARFVPHGVVVDESWPHVPATSTISAASRPWQG